MKGYIRAERRRCASVVFSICNSNSWCGNRQRLVLDSTETRFDRSEADVCDDAPTDLVPNKSSLRCQCQFFSSVFSADLRWLRYELMTPRGDSGERGKVRGKYGLGVHSTMDL